MPGYRLEERLGAGTFGEVWSAVQLTTGQRVAIKFLRLGTGLAGSSFLQEVQRLVRLGSHPNIVAVWDAGLDHQPPYFVMPLLEASLASRAPSSPDQVADWLRQAAEAIRFTHGKGLIHCDLKPSNLLLDERGAVRVADFGQSVDRSEGRASLGSLGTMAPEQAGPPPGQSGPEWEGATPDVRWDVYGLAASGYFLLTGQYPLQPTGNSATDNPLQRYAHWAWTRPLVGVRKLNPRVDRDLAAVLERGLAVDPARRLQTASELLDELDRRRSRRPVYSRRPWTTPYVARRWLQRNPLGALVVALLLAAGFWLMSAATDPWLPDNQGLAGVEHVAAHFPAVSPEDNAYELYLSAWRAVAPRWRADPLELDPEQRARVLAQNKEVLEIMRQARARSAIRVTGEQARQSQPALFPRGAMELVQLCRADARTRLPDDPDGALARILDAVCLTRHLLNAPAGIDCVDADACALEELRRQRLLLTRVSTPSLVSALEQLNDLGGLSPEALYLANWNAELAQLGRPEPGIRIRRWMERGSVPAMERLIAAQFGALQQANFGQCEYQRVRIEVGAWRPFAWLFHPLRTYACKLFQAREFNYSRWRLVFMQQARLDGARLSIACELFRRRRGHLPEKLAELVPDEVARIPADPFDPQAELLYEDGRLWTRGLDLTGSRPGNPDENEDGPFAAGSNRLLFDLSGSARADR